MRNRAFVVSVFCVAFAVAPATTIEAVYMHMSSLLLPNLSLNTPGSFVWANFRGTRAEANGFEWKRSSMFFLFSFKGHPKWKFSAFEPKYIERLQFEVEVPDRKLLQMRFWLLPFAYFLFAQKPIGGPDKPTKCLVDIDIYVFCTLLEHIYYVYFALLWLDHICVFVDLWLMLTVCTVPAYIIGNGRLHAVFAVVLCVCVCVPKCRNSRLMSIQFQWEYVRRLTVSIRWSRQEIGLANS